MFDIPFWSFVVAVISCASYLFFARRRSDFFTIALVGATFYFFPLFLGHVLQSSPLLPSTIQPEVYFIAVGHFLALMVAAIVFDLLLRSAPPSNSPSRRLSAWLLLIAYGCLCAALASTRGALLNPDKMEVLRQVGYLYVTYEIAASLACIAAVVERRPAVFALAILLLFFDLLVGFRHFVTLTAMSVALVFFQRDGLSRLYRGWLRYGLAALVLGGVLLMSHSVRVVIFDQMAVLRGDNVPEQSKASMRSDTIQFSIAKVARPENNATAPPRTYWGATLAIAERLISGTEPFVIQATLVGIIDRNMSCEPANIRKSLYLLVPPGITRFLSNPYPPTFYDEFKPILYPNIDYGLGGNIWAEMLCRFGYTGLAIFIVVMMVLLGAASYALPRVPSSVVAPLALTGTIVGFYIGRNDLHVTLGMARQVLFVFAAAWLASWLANIIAPMRRRSTANGHSQ